MKIVIGVDPDLLCQLLMFTVLLSGAGGVIGCLSQWGDENPNDRLTGRRVLGVAFMIGTISTFLLGLLFRFDGAVWIWPFLLNILGCGFFGAWGLMRKDEGL